MAVNYASVEDLRLFNSALTAQEREQAESLLAAASAKLRLTAKRYGKDLDELVKDEDYLLVVRETVANCVRRAIESYKNDTTASQTSQTALGYSVSMTYLNAGQSLYYLRNELKDLGILRQRYGGMEVYFDDTADQGD
ncbi:MAG: Gp19/Gp15/Gp42 family protein [Ruminococcus sp.]|nr:Gp19/Gp15/Gp42 family protein [Ruminococcus sp.]